MGNVFGGGTEGGGAELGAKVPFIAAYGAACLETMLLRPELPPEEAANLFAAVRGSRLVMVTVETVGITTGVYDLFSAGTVDPSGVGEAGDSMMGEAGDSNAGEAGESIVEEAGDSTIVNFGESMSIWDNGSISEDVGDSISGVSGGANRGDSSPLGFFQDILSVLSLDVETFDFFLAGSSPSIACIWPLRMSTKSF